LALFRATIFCDSATAMLAKIYSAAVYGVDAYEVEIEVNGAGGDPTIVIVGLPDAAVRESRDRVTTAIANSGYYWPRGRTTINLAPADIKSGSLAWGDMRFIGKC
jgi:magnesium chelatase family protein